jgi:hypothetical protein
LTRLADDVKPKLKHLDLQMPMCKGLRACLLELLADPSFFPRLRTFGGPSFDSYRMEPESITRAFNKRWRTIREMQEAMGGH